MNWFLRKNKKRKCAFYRRGKVAFATELRRFFFYRADE
jgi:hypothetical protein